MNAPAEAAAIEFTLDGRAVTARAGETLWEVARRVGVELPHLCHRPGLPPAGNCRACVVEVAGERTLAASCCRAPQPGMQVRTDSERAVRARRTVLELLLADAPASAGLKLDSELEHWARGGAGARRARRHPPGVHGAAGRLHPVHALRARLPRRAGQRRAGPGRPRRAGAHRLRPG